MIRRYCIRRTMHAADERLREIVNRASLASCGISLRPRAMPTPLPGRPLIREAHGRVHFAGGDIAAVGVGGIDGATETGAKAARDIIRALVDERE
jgi:hypothetical protein